MENSVKNRKWILFYYNIGKKKSKTNNYKCNFNSILLIPTHKRK